MTTRKVYVAGATGMVGSAIVRHLNANGVHVITADRATVDLREREATRAFFRAAKPQVVIVAAAVVGGIIANMAAPVQHLRDNLLIATNLIEAASAAGVEKLLFLGSSCMYPRDAAQPMTETALGTGPLEPTNAGYALAKLAGVELCKAYRAQYGRDFISAIPCNLYGPGDNFDLQRAHVLPALIARIHAAKVEGAPSVPLLGSGRVRREFLHVDDLAHAAWFLVERYSEAEPINVGSGVDLTVLELAHLVAEVVGYSGAIVPGDGPDGMPRKLLDVSRISAMGWRPEIELRPGIEATYQWFKERTGREGPGRQAILAL